ncbi:hypothetical protein NUSPORA_01315 [Nucleospora cyclopteri]
MKIKITNKILQNSTFIHDDKQYPPLSSNTNYLLIFTTGKNTLQVFKDIFVTDNLRDSCTITFYVINLEFFLDKMRCFRNLSYEISLFKSDEELDYRHKTIRKIEKKYVNKKGGNFLINKLKTRLSAENLHFSNSKTIHFIPDILTSIKTSLIRSDLYLSEESVSSKIFKVVLEKRAIKIEEVKEEIKEEIEEGVKSLISCGIIKNKEGVLSVSELLK